MPWVRFDEQFPQHPKIVSLPYEAIGVLLVAICYCNQYLTDGWVPASVLAPNAHGDARRALAALVAAGVLQSEEKAAGDGFRIHDYLKYQPSRRQVLRARALAKHRKDKWLAAVRGTRTERRSERVGNGVRNAFGTHMERTTPIPIPIPVRTTDVPLELVPTESATAPAPVALPPGLMLSFPVVGMNGHLWTPTPLQLTRWGACFPGLDVPQEVRKALAWVEADPARRKTPRGMPRFLVAWFTRATDQGGRPPWAPSPTGRESSMARSAAALHAHLARKGAPR